MLPTSHSYIISPFLSSPLISLFSILLYLPPFPSISSFS